MSSASSKEQTRRWERAFHWTLVAMAFGLPFYIAVSQNLFVLAALLWIAVQVRERRLLLTRTPLDVGFLAYLVAELIALPFSTNVPQSVLYLRRFLLISMVYLVGCSVRDERWLRRLISAFFAGMIVYSAWGLVFFAQHPDMRVRHIQNSITTGGIAFLGATLALAVFLVERDRRTRWLSGTAAVLSAICLFLTNTRGSWLAFLTGVVILAAVTNWRLLLAVPLVVVLGYVAVPQSQKVRVRGFFDPNWESNRNRLVWWRTGWEMFKDHPVVGIGDVGTEKLYLKYRRSPDEQPVGHMHNNFLHIAVTLGVIGLAGFGFMLAKIFVFLWRTYKAASNRLARGVAIGGLAAFTGFNVNGLFEWNFGDQEVVTILWFVVGLSLAVWRMGQESSGTTSV